MSSQQNAMPSATGETWHAGGRRYLDIAREYGIVLGFVTLFVTLSIASDPFLTTSNLLNVLDQNAAIGIMACAGTLVFVAGGFDLSVAAVFALSGVIAAKVAADVNVPVGLASGVLVGVLVGSINGVLTTVGRVNPFIATLASSIIVRGLAALISGGVLLTVANESFSVLGADKIGPMKITIWIWIAVAIALGVLLARTTFGRSVYACGGNPEAARLSGVRVGLVRGATFALSGAAAAIAGVLEASRVSTGQADSGLGLELTVVAGIVIGGTSISGGEGAVWRSVLGVMLLALIGNGFNLLGVNSNYQQMFQGFIILGAVALDAWTRKRS